MSAKNLFIFLSAVIVLGSISVILFILNPKSEQITSLETRLNITTNKYQNATHAKNDVAHAREILQKSEKKMADIKGRFIRREELRKVTHVLKEQTQKFNLSFDEFTPIFKAYLQDKSIGQAKALPFSISVSGNYFKIGKFLESWSTLPFYMFSDELYLIKDNKRGDGLKANISGRLYAWAKEK